MYLKNPNPKVSYSFRIKPELLENLKLYAAATNQTVPEVINQLITEKMDGVTLTNDYLENFDDQYITIPDINTIYDNTDTKTMFEKMDLLNPILQGSKYLVLQTPNNLDVWDTTDYEINQHGYTSPDFPIYLHEGIEVFLAPELITPDLLQRDDKNIIIPFCLLFIHFGVNNLNKLEITLLTFREAMDKAKASNNFELMDKLSTYRMEVDGLINKFCSDIPEKFTPDPNEAWSNETEMYKYYTDMLRDMLRIKADNINTGNVGITKFKVNDSKVTLKRLVVNDEVITELVEENKELKDRVNELEVKIREYNNTLDMVNKVMDKVTELDNVTWSDVINDIKQ